MIDNICGFENAGKLLKANSELWEEPEDYGTDLFGFGILPSGTCKIDDDGALDCFNDGDESHFVTSSTDTFPGGDFITFNEDHSITTTLPGGDRKISCRCVKDK